MSKGDQPDGTMSVQRLMFTLPGYEHTSTRTIQISYHIPSGIQSARHPQPGKAFHGATRLAYLPDTIEGRRVLELLQRAFDNKLVFTVGQSRTTGLDSVVTWNDIHHKTHVDGGPQKYTKYMSILIAQLHN